MSKPGWLKAQIEDAKEEIRSWPQWLRQARGLDAPNDNRPKQPEERSQEDAPNHVSQGINA